MLGQIVVSFAQDDDTQAWALCMDIHSLDLLASADSDPWFTEWTVSLNVQPHALSRFTGEVEERIKQRATEIVTSNGHTVNDVVIKRLWPKQDSQWREAQRERESRMALSVTNQARRPAASDLPHEDGFVFRSTAELAVYRVLKKLQNDGMGFAILALPLARLSSGNVVEPDFVIAVNKRIGVIEVDGYHHNGRRAADASRERLFRPSGIWMFERLLAEDTRDENALSELLVKWIREVGEQ
jgi:hypothetical protein